MEKNSKDDQVFPEVAEERGFLGWRGKNKFTDAPAIYYRSLSVGPSGERTFFPVVVGQQVPEVRFGRRLPASAENDTPEYLVWCNW